MKHTERLCTMFYPQSSTTYDLRHLLGVLKITVTTQFKILKGYIQRGAQSKWQGYDSGKPNS